MCRREGKVYIECNGSDSRRSHMWRVLFHRSVLVYLLWLICEIAVWSMNGERSTWCCHFCNLNGFTLRICNISSTSKSVTKIVEVTVIENHRGRADCLEDLAFQIFSFTIFLADDSRKYSWIKLLLENMSAALAHSLINILSFSLFAYSSKPVLKDTEVPV